MGKIIRKRVTENCMSSKKLIRSSAGRMVAGVCGGLGDYFDIDPTLFRIAFVITAIFGGAGILVYVVLWIIVPETERDTITGEERLNKFGKEVEGYVKQIADDVKQSTEKNNESFPHNKRNILLAVVLIVIGVVFILNNYLPHWNAWNLWPVVIIVFGVWLLWKAQPIQSNDEGEEKEEKEKKKSEETKDKKAKEVFTQDGTISGGKEETKEEHN